MNINQKLAKLVTLSSLSLPVLCFASRFVSCTALLVLAAPLGADTPQTIATGRTVPPVLDKLIGKPQVIGLTERSGSRCLGRVLSGDHGLYLIQTFHYVSAPLTTPVTTLQTSTVTGRNRRPSQVTKKVTTHITTQNVIPDDQAVQALLSGVTGPSYRPREEAGPREMVSPTDVLCVQELSPPPSHSASAGWTMKTLWVSPDLPVSKAQSGKQSKK